MSLQRFAVLTLAVAWTLAVAPPTPASGHARYRHHHHRHHKRRGVYLNTGTGSGAVGTGSASRGQCSIPDVTLVPVGAGTAAFTCPGHDSGTAVFISSPFWMTSEAFGRIDYGNPGITLWQLWQLSTDYEFTTGSCWSGSPRSQIDFQPPGVAFDVDNIYVYLGPPPGYRGCQSGWQTTGNLVVPSAQVDDSDLPGGSPRDTFAQAVAKYGSWPIVDLWLGMDGGNYGSQTAIFDNMQINGNGVLGAVGTVWDTSSAWPPQPSRANTRVAVAQMMSGIAHRNK